MNEVEAMRGNRIMMKGKWRREMEKDINDNDGKEEEDEMRKRRILMIMMCRGRIMKKRILAFPILLFINTCTCRPIVLPLLH